MSARTLLRGGCVLTLGDKTPNFAQADVLLADGRVAEVGPGLRIRDAEVVDAADTIVMPGFVDAHRHAWKSLFRNLGSGPHQESGELYGQHCGPDDVYAATLIGLLGAVEAGVTTVVDWSDIQFDDTATEAVIQAHVDAGLRTVLVHSPPLWAEDHQEVDAGARLAARHAGAAGPMTTVAYGSREPVPANVDRVASEWGLARELGLRVHAHAGTDESHRGAVTALGAQSLLGADVTLVHCTMLDDADLDAISSSGASVALTPSTEMAGGLGSPPLQQLIDHGIRPGLGVDDEHIAPGDLFAQMRAAISIQHATVFDLKLAGKAHLPRLLSTRDVIRYGTVDGARVAGLREVTGSLEPGMQADIVVLRTDRPNIFPVNDPIGAVVWGMDTSNIDWVFVGGRALVRGGALEADVARARHLAEAARQRVAAAAGLVLGAAPGAGG